MAKSSTPGEPTPNPNPIPVGHGSSGIVPMHSVGHVVAALPIVFSGLIALAQVGADYMAHNHFYETLKHVQERAAERRLPTNGQHENAEKGLIVDELPSWLPKAKDAPQPREPQIFRQGKSNTNDESILFGLSAITAAVMGRFSYSELRDDMSAKPGPVERTPTDPKEGSRKDPPHPFRRRKRRNRIKK